MPELNVKIEARCDDDGSVLECGGGFFNVEQQRLVSVYTCPQCNFAYIALDGAFLNGKWKVIADPTETMTLQAHIAANSRSS